MRKIWKYLGSIRQMCCSEQKEQQAFLRKRKLSLDISSTISEHSQDLISKNLFFFLAPLVILCLLFFLCDDKIPYDRTTVGQLERLCNIIIIEIEKNGNIPNKLDDIQFDDDDFYARCREEYESGLIKWYVVNDELVVEFKNDVRYERVAKRIRKKRH